ncbi:phosphatidate cytidylyltransferase [Malaciobacter mytili]|uniref:Phosphatidate cytidylyltransferase n=1 Tax=Malaciobacter mytili LMG 24559 TaxID=1032238 RepID=A0AAX2AFG2_9BACT|nr:phosphatidate cytidylyltransferase [Malaciobacter mytili]AXH13868.1 CDP-diglyceride synthetase [Malaciobacter mytili LMG 24559]RXI37159.1 phosphatidate cytidylyltransferase [Malaciobacter mytili]RXK15479.1 phosphatidate cytidylyltransferase [Malaciobacter mytili LMG 24559]
MSNLLSSSSTRIKTGVVLVLALLLIGYINSYFITWLFLGSLMIIAISESMKLFNVKNNIIFAFAIALWAIAYFYPSPEDLFFVLAVVYASILAYKRDIGKKLFLPLLYPAASFLFILALYNEYSMSSLLWLLVIVALTDTAAYFVGRSIGKRKFCATSPNKTIEGVIGGVLFGSLLGAFFAIEQLSYSDAFIISLFVSIASVFGDLFESYLKREANVKDSGNLFPGHGGVLDRTDGYLFASVLMLVILRVVA